MKEPGLERHLVYDTHARYTLQDHLYPKDLSFERDASLMERRETTIFRLTVPRSARRASRVLAISQRTKADLVQLYGHEEGRVRGRDAVLLREGKTVAHVVDLPWDEQDPLHRNSVGP